VYNLAQAIAISAASDKPLSALLLFSGSSGNNSRATRKLVCFLSA